MTAVHEISSQYQDQRHVVSGTKLVRERDFLPSLDTLGTQTAITPTIGGSTWHVSSRAPHTPHAQNSGQWNHEKKEHQRSQKRAFASLKDNPFSRFKHDPNDLETQLEFLSSRSPKAPGDSIIPSESLRMLDAVYREKQSTFDRGAQFQEHARRMGATRRSFGASSLPAGRDLLSLKAEEASMYSTVRAPPVLQSSFHQALSYHSTQLPFPRNGLDNFQLPKAVSDPNPRDWLADEYQHQRAASHSYMSHKGFAPAGFDQINPLYSHWSTLPPNHPYAHSFKRFTAAEHGMHLIQNPESPLQYQVHEMSFEPGLDFRILHPNDPGTFGFK
jgi:hypothetical protein